MKTGILEGNAKFRPGLITMRLER